MAAPSLVVFAKKAAAILITDRQTWTVIGSIIGAIVAFIVIAVTVIFGGISTHNTAKEEGNAAMRTGLNILFADGELPDNSSELSAIMPAEYRNGIEAIKAMMTKIEAEIINQGLGTDPLKAQVIALSLLLERADDESFCRDFLSCFAGADDNDADFDTVIFDAIAAKFGMNISADDRVKILELYQNAREYCAEIMNVE